MPLSINDPKSASRSARPSANIGPCALRVANSNDAAAIFDLAQSVLGWPFLKYTVYQSARSKKYIEHLLASPELNNHFTVAIKDDRVCGYYHAVRCGGDYFLNYMAVAPFARGTGAGIFLLQHALNEAQLLGCANVGMDVFDSNKRVCDWYVLEGFEPVSTRYIGLLEMCHVTLAEQLLLQVEPDLIATALSEEKLWGFSRIEATCGGGHVTVGLINDRVCKLLDYGGVNLELAIAAIRRHFCGQRESLIVSSDEPLPASWAISSWESITRFQKGLH